MGPYYLTALVNLLGPAKQVWGSLMWNKKRIIGIGPRKGKSIKVLCPTTYLGTIFFKNKTIIDLHFLLMLLLIIETILNYMEIKDQFLFQIQICLVDLFIHVKNWVVIGKNIKQIKCLWEK